MDRRSRHPLSESFLTVGQAAERLSVHPSTIRRWIVETAEPIVAPPIRLGELANVIRQRRRQGALDRAAGRAILSQFLAIPIAPQTPETLYDRALVLADERNLPAIYDALYVALAHLLGASLWTADQRLLRALGGRLPFVRGLADYSSS